MSTHLGIFKHPRVRIEAVNHKYFVDIWVNGGWKNDSVWDRRDQALDHKLAIYNEWAAIRGDANKSNKSNES